MEKPKVSSGKSAGTLYWKKKLPKVGENFGKGCNLFCIDSLQEYRNLPDPFENEVPGRQALQFIGARAKSQMMRGHATTIAMCFDDSNYVPSSKGEEQYKRDKAMKKKLEDKMALDPRKRPRWFEKKNEELFGEDVPITHDWDLALHSRQTFRRRMTAWVCKTYCIQFPIVGGKELILMGHCFGEEECEEFDLDQKFAMNTPLRITIDAENGGRRKIEWAHDLENRVGEAEAMMAFLYVRYGSEPTITREKALEYEEKGGRPGAIFRSTDSDVFYIALLHRMNVTWWYSKDTRESIEIEKASEYLRLNHPEYENPERTLVCLAYTGGSDYTNPWGGLTHEHFMIAYEGCGKFIGDAPEVYGDEFGEWVTRCLLAAYSVSKNKKEAPEELKVERSLKNVKQLCARCREKGFASQECVTKRSIQLAFALMMIDGAVKDRLDLPDAFDYEYAEMMDDDGGTVMVRK